MGKKKNGAALEKNAVYEAEVTGYTAEGAGVVRVYPECDSVRAAAQAAGLPLPEAFALAQAAAREHHD